MSPEEIASHYRMERAAFEEWVTNNGTWPKASEKDSAGNYKLMQTATQWGAWKAAIGYLKDQ